MEIKLDKNLAPVIIALGIALIATIWYVLSGRGSYDLNVRGLATENNVKKIDASDSKTITIKCRDGQSYEISFKKDQPNYDDLVFNVCGPEGTQEQ